MSAYVTAMTEHGTETADFLLGMICVVGHAMSERDRFKLADKLRDGGDAIEGEFGLPECERVRR